MPIRLNPQRTCAHRFARRFVIAGAFSTLLCASVTKEAFAGSPLALDCLPPSTPVVSVTEVGATHVSFAWSSSDDGPYVWYTLYQDGVPISGLEAAETGTAYLLEPATSYVFTVRARDFGGNFSPLSEPLLVTTAPADGSDATPPSVPADIVSDVFDNEISLRWTAAVDDRDAQSLLRYEVFVNGVLSDVAAGGRTQAVVYGVNGDNAIEIVAIDTAGNRSAPLQTTIHVVF